MINYLPRLIDKDIEESLHSIGATYIVGPKWCGKTTTAKEHSKSIIDLSKPIEFEKISQLIKTMPDIIFEKDKPLLIDEWQEIPQLWDYVRNYCDNNQSIGDFLLTGSTSKKVKTLHSGTGRITKLMMYPMSLFESNDSNGTFSISELFSGKIKDDYICHSEKKYKDLIYLSCRGGWPSTLSLDDDRRKLNVAKQYYKMLISEDINHVDSVKRNQSVMDSLLKSYARNISTLAKKNTIIDDVLGRSGNSISENTFDDYLDVLERLYIVDDIYGWTPQIRSKDSMRSGRKREFIDPSLAVAALGLSVDSLENDLKSFGFIFENLCSRDLKIYSNSIGGKLSYYRDKTGLECDFVIQLQNDDYGLIEVKLSNYDFNCASKNLCKLENLIKEKINSDKSCRMKPPTFKMILTGFEYGFKDENGIYIVPIGCLRD